MPKSDIDPPRPGRPRIVTLAFVGAIIAGDYWALLTVLIKLDVLPGSMSSAQLMISLAVFGSFVLCSYQMRRPKEAVMKTVLGLHVVGGIFGIMHAAQASGYMAVLHAIKVSLHIFGAAFVYLALQHIARERSAE